MNRLEEIEAGGAEFARTVQWLTASRLAVSDLGEGSPHFLIARSGDEPVGYAGLTGDGADRLLRSVILDPARRGRGDGAALVAQVETYAREHGTKRLWLLTELAPGFFERVGYLARGRETAPQAIRKSSQFRGLCPASAVLMCKTLP